MPGMWNSWVIQYKYSNIIIKSNHWSSQHKKATHILQKIPTLFISLNVLTTWPSPQDFMADKAKASISDTKLRSASRERDLWTSFLRRMWYSPWWKNKAQGPIKRSLLLGYVGLNKWAWVTSTNRAASGLVSITQGQPRMLVLNISPYLKKINHNVWLH